jgi:hypothetical protein
MCLLLLCSKIYFKLTLLIKTGAQYNKYKDMKSEKVVNKHRDAMISLLVEDGDWWFEASRRYHTGCYSSSKNSLDDGENVRNLCFNTVFCPENPA